MIEDSLSSCWTDSVFTMDPARPPRLNSVRNNHLTEEEAQTSGDNPTSGSAQGHSAGPQAGDRQPQYSGAFTMFPPNETRRSQIQMVAQRGEEMLQRQREAQRVPYVQVTPETLGGNATLAEVRQKQQMDLRCSKVQKRMKQKELDERKRKEEEEKQQKMKEEQREKAERQAKREEQEQQRRKQQLEQDHLRKKDSFLQRFERTAPDPLSSSGATHTSSRIEAAESRRGKSVRGVQLDHKRVNCAFLDKLQGLGVGSEGETEREGVQEAEWPSAASNDLKHKPSPSTGQQLPPAHLKPDPEHSWTQEAELDPDHDWDLMKLMNRFPDCSQVFLQDILLQCNGDFEEALTLLTCTFS
ncbi:epithelial-stromal interaction protein 1 isoform X1 [Paralichthys olivaceus]|uniref:epithelial-stromal interaction protein 1 isoform X1 n=2 Tax=Paralichthys olivaceus TaxID=8255 RepID=UPI003751F396